MRREHGALHEDVTGQERPLSWLFEEEIELKWEKAAPGLVFYTTAQFCRRRKEVMLAPGKGRGGPRCIRSGRLLHAVGSWR